ncbi:MAG: DNA-binding transcriptional regulator BaeR [Bacteroidetes bacterium]|nr:DNA-binding transcriptional regulator BaeR [Bacteroidota bacterium]
MKINREKVLILEDNLSDAKLLQRELQTAGWNTIQISQTRSEFESALSNFLPDIILADYSLPSFDGVTAFHISQKHSDIPFIIVSGIIGEENAVELIKSGITDYVLKDKLFTLTHKITRALKESEEKKAKINTAQKLKIQNEKLFEIAFLQSHQVRVPVAHILGLFDLFKFDEPGHPINAEVLSQLKTSAQSLDKIVQDIVLKTREIKDTLN